MRWAKRQRLEFVEAKLRDPGFLNRADLIAKFGISPAQAAVDFADFQRLNPQAMTYNKSAKRYEAARQEDAA